MKPKIKVRFLILHYLPIYSGAAGSLHKLINSLNKDRFEVEIVTTHIRGYKRKDTLGKVKIRRLGHGFFGKDGLLNSYGKLCFFFSLFFFSLFSKKYDILHLIGSGKLALPALFFSEIYNKKRVNKITRVGDDDPESMEKTLLGRIVNKLLSKNTSHLIISPQILEICEKQKTWNPNSFHLIPNPVEIFHKNWNDIQLLRNKYDIDKKVRFLFAGVLAKHKGLDLLLSLWEDNNFDAELIICGVEMPSAGSNELIERIKNCENVKWLGRLNKEELKLQYLKCNAFLFPSLVEGLPNVVLEAMSLGILCITNLIEGVTDYLLEENRGITIQNNSIDIWKTEIEKVINFDKNQQEMPVNAFKWVCDNADATKVAIRIQGLYQNSAKNK